MRFDPTLAAIRYGAGLAPDRAPPADVAALLAELAGADSVAQAVPIPTFAALTPGIGTLKDAQRLRREALGTEDEERTAQVLRDLNTAARDLRAANLRATLARMVAAPVGLRERLTLFWADHFTIRARGGQYAHAVTPAVEEVIRPHAAGRFPEMLRAVATHPMMLLYLDQHSSVGPHSIVGLSRRRGMNENLAREMLELHTVGVGAGYTQTDVLELAELLTGLTYRPAGGFTYNPRNAEPGAETVLGVTYDAAASLATVHAALDDLALHPQTAAHLSRKLAVHFIGSDPEPKMLDWMIDAYRASDGDILSAVAAMLEHPAAFVPGKQKVRRPIEFMAATARALTIPPEAILALDRRRTRQKFHDPLRVMGQPWEEPPGPDGWPESDAAWITPQGMAGRIGWAMEVPVTLRRDLPDPRDFVHHALGPNAPAEVSFAAQASENRIEGVGVVLASAAFQRR